MSLPTRRLSHLDAALFALETPTNHMNLGLLAEFDAGSNEDIAALLKERLSANRRYYDLRLTVRPSRIGYTAPKLIDGGPLDLEYHVQSVELGGKGSEEALSEWIGRELSYPLDRSKPLWQLTVITGLKSGGFALFLKGHHGIMDGPAALMTALQILDGDRTESSSHVTRGFLRGNLGRLSSAFGGFQDYFRWPVRVIRTVFDPTRRMVRIQNMDRARAFSAPRTSLNRSISGDRVAERTSVNLETIIEIRRNAECTGTDVVLAVVGNALRRVLEARNELPVRPLTALVPVAQSGESWSKRSGNRVSFEFVSLATNIEDPASALASISESSKAARFAARLRGSDLWERYAGLVLPGPFHQLAMIAERTKLSNRIRPLASAIISNLTGPRASVSLGDAPLIALYPFGPPKDGGAINVTAVSYLDKLYFGIAGDKALAKDIALLRDEISNAVAELSVNSKELTHN